jgi:hypothetical protein
MKEKTRRRLCLVAVLLVGLLTSGVAVLGAESVLIDFTDQLTIQKIAASMGVPGPPSPPKPTYLEMLDPSKAIQIETSQGIVYLRVTDGELGIGDVNGDSIWELWIPNTTFEITFEWGTISNVSGIATDYCDAITVTAWKDIAKMFPPAYSAQIASPTLSNQWVSLTMVLPNCELLEIRGVESVIKYLLFEVSGS